MAGLLAAQTRTDLSHAFQHIAVAHFCLLDLDTVFLSHQEKTQITHDRRNNGVTLKLPLSFHMIAHDGHDLVTIHDISQLIHRQQPVSVSVKSQTQLCLLIDHPCLQLLHMCGTTVCIDVRAVGIVVDRHDLSAQLLHSLHRGIECCTLCTVKHDLHPPQIHIHRFHCMIDILFSGIRTVFDLANACAGGELNAPHIAADQLLDLILQGIRKLVAVPIEKFNTVKLYCVVGSGDHDTRVHLIFSGKIRHRRSGHHTHIHCVRTHGTHACHQSIRQHIS